MDLVFVILLVVSILGATVGSYFVAGIATLTAIAILIGCTVHAVTKCFSH